MRAPQYVVIYHPYAHILAEAIGPFRTMAKAVAAMEKMDTLDIEQEDMVQASAAPYVVTLKTLAGGLAHLKDLDSR